MDILIPLVIIIVTFIAAPFIQLAVYKKVQRDRREWEERQKELRELKAAQDLDRVY